MKKKMHLIVLFVLFLPVLIVGCSQESETISGNLQTNNIESEEFEEFVLRYAHVVPETHATHIASVQFKEEVEKISDGKIKIEIYPNGQLYSSEREGIEATMLGNLDMMIIGVPALASFDSRFMVLDLPFLFDTREQAHAALDGELGKELNDILSELGLTGIGWGESGFKHMLTNTGPIYTVDDFNGLTLRVMENRLYQDTFNLYGARATPLAFGELYSALQQRVFDGADQPISLIASNKFHEVAEHLTMTGHVYAAALTFINSDVYNQMPEELQNIILEAGTKIFENSYRELAFQQDTKLLEELKGEGLQVYELTSEQKREIKKASIPIYEKYEEAIGKELIEIAKKYSQ